jgi:hypothetical protein
MARDFVAVDGGQLFLMPPSLVEWLPEDHLVWTVLGAVEVMISAASRRPTLALRAVRPGARSRQRRARRRPA